MEKIICCYVVFWRHRYFTFSIIIRIFVLARDFITFRLPFILVLTARAFFHIIQGIAVLRRSSEMHVKNAFIALLFMSVIFTGVFRMPKLYRFYSDSFWYVDNKLMKKVQALGINNALIFQKSYGYKGNALGSGFLYNSPGLQDPVVFARDLGERNHELAPVFPWKKLLSGCTG